MIYATSASPFAVAIGVGALPVLYANERRLFTEVVLMEW
jgi:hypothetical protein